MEAKSSHASYQSAHAQSGSSCQHAHVASIMQCNMHYLRRLYSSSIGFQWGEYVLSEDQNGRQRLFKLKEEAVFKSSIGNIAHRDIATRAPCQKFETDLGAKLLLRRPTLAEYVCLMKRVATPAYPKDIWALLGYMDIGGGARVVEAGTGSGALTLHLSNQGAH